HDDTGQRPAESHKNQRRYGKKHDSPSFRFHERRQYIPEILICNLRLWIFAGLINGPTDKSARTEAGGKIRNLLRDLAS
ncbi:MAG: hypothetical protein IKO93_12505, partial [Lentisphaeria bacterium]|nr:hypothetical protein [Lentisphaeria bacterium]